MRLPMTKLLAALLAAAGLSAAAALGQGGDRHGREDDGTNAGHGAEGHFAGPRFQLAAAIVVGLAFIGIRNFLVPTTKV